MYIFLSIFYLKFNIKNQNIRIDLQNNALKNLQEKYYNLKEEYLKLLKIEESAKDNTKFKDLMVEDGGDLKRGDKNCEKMIEP